MAGRKWTADERREIDSLLRKRRIDAALERIQRDGSAIKKHCKATADEIRVEADKHLKHISEREALELGMKLAHGPAFRRKMGLA